MRRFYSAIFAIAFALSLGYGLTSTAQAAPKTMATPCRDAKGKFTKCKPSNMSNMMMASPKPKRCRDKMGKFTKCKM